MIKELAEVLLPAANAFLFSGVDCAGAVLDKEAPLSWTSFCTAKEAEYLLLVVLMCS